MESEGLVARTNRLLIAYQSHDVETLRGLVAPDVRIRPLSTDLAPGPEYDGVDGVERWTADLAASDRDFQPAVTAIEEHGRNVVVVGCVYAADASGRLEKTDAAWVFEFGAQDRLVAMHAYLDHDEARAAATRR